MGLKVANLKEVSYKHTHSSTNALNNVTVNLGVNESLLITGVSGSGKSTLLAVLCGLIPHYFGGDLQGEIYVAGKNTRSTDVAELGKYVGIMFQNPELQFFASTVYEDFLLALKCRGFTDSECAQIIEEQLIKFKIQHIKDAEVTKLSEGQKQKVVLAQLMALKPRLILLDEPSANLDPLSIAELKELLAELKNEGISFIIADHRLSWLNGICEKCMILSEGEVAWQGDFDDMQAQCADFNLRSTKSVEKERLQLFEGNDGVHVCGLGFSYDGSNSVFSGTNFCIPFDKITVLNGHSGMGKTTLARVLAGLEKNYSGDIFFGSEKISGRDLTHRVSLVLQNCDHQLYMSSVSSEIAASLGHKVKRTDTRITDVLNNFGLAPLADRHPQSLSGGEKQRLVIATGTNSPGGMQRLIILDEPTSGLDGGNLKLMAAHIKSLKDLNTAVLVITHDVELINMCADYKISLNKEVKV